MNAASRRRRAGQALLESCLVIAILSLVLFGILQVARLHLARETLDYAATAAARARTVGFNDFMVHKVVRVAAIPAAGALLNPEVEREPALAATWAGTRPGLLWDYALAAAPASPQFEIERSRVPLYLAAQNGGQLQAILDYELWPQLHYAVVEAGSAEVRADTRLAVPLTLPFHRAFYAADEVTLEGRADLENHASLYLE
jgi:hypothetical protein